MKHIRRDRQRDLSAARLRRLIPEIMRRWEAQVLAAIPAARSQERLLLYDDIPQILAELAQSLAIGAEEFLEDSPASKAHARQRVGIEDYSLSQVIQEYHLLRRVVVKALTEEAPLDEGARALIHADIDRSIEECVTEYVRLQQAALAESTERQRLLVAGSKTTRSTCWIRRAAWQAGTRARGGSSVMQRTK